MNLQMKCHRVKSIFETFLKKHIKVFDFEAICQKTKNNLDIQIDTFNKILSLSKVKQ